MARRAGSAQTQRQPLRNGISGAVITATAAAEPAPAAASALGFVVERHRVELEAMVDQLDSRAVRAISACRRSISSERNSITSPVRTIDKMVMVGVGDLLVARAAFAEIVTLDDAGVLEQLHGAVDRRDRDAVVDRGAAAIKLLDVRDGPRPRPARARSRAAGRSCACRWRRISLRSRWSCVATTVGSPGGFFYQLS